jgi:hypothetical protein
VKRGKVTNKGRLAASLAFNCGLWDNLKLGLTPMPAV